MSVGRSSETRSGDKSLWDRLYGRCAMPRPRGLPPKEATDGAPDAYWRHPGETTALSAGVADARIAWSWNCCFDEIAALPKVRPA